MSARPTLQRIIFYLILAFQTIVQAQSTVEVDYVTLGGEAGIARLALPLYALKSTDRVSIFREVQRNKLELATMELITFAEDTLFRRFSTVAPEEIWQLLVWGDYSLYRSVGSSEESSFVLDYGGAPQHLQARNFIQEFKRATPRGAKPLLRKKSHFSTPQLTRATRRLNRRHGEQEAFIYTPFEVSRWQFEAGLRILLTSPFVLRTSREQDFGLVNHLGLNRRIFNHLPFFWLHLGLDQHTYRGNNTQVVIRQPDYLRSLRYSEWQTALGLRVEAAPQWAISPYAQANALFILPTHTTYTQRSDPDRPRPPGLPFLIEQRGQGRLSTGFSVAVGLRIQLSDFWSFHAQYLGQRVPRVVEFQAPQGSSDLALDGDVRWQEFRQPALQFHLQFAIR